MKRAMLCFLLVASGCEHSEEHVMTLAPRLTGCQTWEPRVGLCPVVISDDGDYYNVLPVEGLTFGWGETRVIHYLQIDNDNSGNTDGYAHRYELIEVLSSTQDALGAAYTVPVRAWQATAEDDNEIEIADEVHLTPATIGCDPTLCTDVVAADGQLELSVELLDSAGTLRLASFTVE